jgi:flagellar hook-length control protein FliK
MVQPALQPNPLQSALFQVPGLKVTAKHETAETFGLLLEKLVSGGQAGAQEVGIQADAQLAALVVQQPLTPPAASSPPAADGLTHAPQNVGGTQLGEAAVLADAGKSLPQIAEAQLSIMPINIPRSENGVSSPAQAIPASAAQQLIPVRVDTSAWANALGERMILMANRLEQVAELKLNPPHLGPLEVRLHFSGGEASAQFFAHQPAVREALETAVPRLRELFSEIGVQLGDVAVDTPSAHGRETQPGNENYAGGSRPARLNDSEEASRSVMLRWEGWVDTFA